MDYRTKRLLGTIVTTAIVLLVWALITGTAHAQSRASIFTTEQLYAGIPQANRVCVHDGPDSPDCRALDAIINEILARGALRSVDVPTISKLRLIAALNERCLQVRVCAYDPVIMSEVLARQLATNHITPEQFLRTMDTNEGELCGMAPTFAPVLVTFRMNVQRAIKNGF